MRIVLPGTQAFLGFQLIATRTDAFSKLPRPEQFCHLGSLGLVALSEILLMTPPAYHRVAERGHMTERFLNLASFLVVCAMLPLALGICLDLTWSSAKSPTRPHFPFPWPAPRSSPSSPFGTLCLSLTDNQIRRPRVIPPLRSRKRHSTCNESRCPRLCTGSTAAASILAFPHGQLIQ